MNELTQYIKTAFEYKNNGHYKEALDYFYKALTIDNDSCEIMTELSIIYSKLNKPDRAISFCEQILALKPNDYQTRLFMSQLYKKSGSYEKAKDQLLKMLKTKENLLNTVEELFSVFSKLNKPDKILEIYNSNQEELNSSIVYYYVGWAYLAKKEKEKAEEYFKKSFDTDKNNVESGSRVAEVLFEEGAYDEAESILNNLLKHSENDRIFYLLAELNYIKSDFDKAINYYILAIKLNDRNAQYYYKLASAYMEKGFLDQAEENYCRAITIEPDNKLYNYTLAYLYFINDKYSLSNKILDSITSSYDSYIDAYILKLQILLKENNISEAEKIAYKILNEDEKTERAYYVLALYYSKFNMWQKSIDNIKKAISEKPESCDYNFELAAYYYETEEFEKSKKVCEKILQINDKYINAYILLAKIYLEEQDYSASSENVEAALKLDTNVAEVYYIKGVIANRRGDKQKAIDNFRTALSMSPQEVEYYEAAADCYYEIKDYESAFRYYKEASELDIANCEYRYKMAKCAENNDDIKTAVANYSVAKRLSPLNVLYIEDYAKALATDKKKKQAISVIKSSMKNLSKEDKNKLKQLINKL